jgi:maleylacetoacetate isomerase
LILYTYGYSSAAFRVRIALNLKGLGYEPRYVHLRRGGGEQFAADYRALNPLQEVPTLVDGERVISQSLAILEYLEETHPAPPLLPQDPYLRAKARQICQGLNAGIHPLGNLKVLRYLENDLHLLQEARTAWYQHWVGGGLAALEDIVRPLAGRYAVGDQVSMADCCVIPQMYNAFRNQVDVTGCATLRRIWETCIAQPAFAQAHPDQQPDIK